MKIKLDKYYTSTKFAEYCINKTNEIIGIKNITQYLEPSAGNGSFSNYLKDSIQCIAYDIDPEEDRIIKQDYLNLELLYKKGRCIIGNPPYGVSNTLAVKFYKHAIQQGDYISFILPISQLNNNMQMYEFDMIHSEDLGVQSYSTIDVHCCLNIYKRNENGYNKKPKYDLIDVSFVEIRKNKHGFNNIVPYNYDFTICTFGSEIGKLCNENQYANQLYITIHNNNLKHIIKKTILQTNWKIIYQMTKTPKLNQWQIYKYLKQQIPNIK